MRTGPPTSLGGWEIVLKVTHLNCWTSSTYHVFVHPAPVFVCGCVFLAGLKGPQKSSTATCLVGMKIQENTLIAAPVFDTHTKNIPYPHTTPHTYEDSSALLEKDVYCSSTSRLLGNCIICLMLLDRQGQPLNCPSLQRTLCYYLKTDPPPPFWGFWENLVLGW